MRKTALELSLALLLTSVLSGCGNGGSGSPPPPPPPPSISITPASANIAAGGSQQFAASMSGNANPSVRWQVNGVAGGNATLGMISASGLYAAPLSAASVTISAVLQSNQSDFGKAQVTVLAPHHFGVRTTSTLAEFYDRNTGNAFTPRGNNYIRLAYLTDPNGNQLFAHSTFSIGLYDAAHAESALAAMQASGYNVVTVTLQGCCQNTIGNPAGGLSSAYIANMVDFLKTRQSTLDRGCGRE